MDGEDGKANEGHQATGEVVDEGKVGQLAMEPFFSFLFYEYKILLAPNRQTTKEQSP